MSKKYEALAHDIIENLGGKENITDVYHCQTRLRFTLVDESKADFSQLEDLDGVAKYVYNAGVHQVIIGTHVKEVYEEIEKNVDVASSKEEKSQKKSVANTIIDFVAGTFQPIIPALSGAGMIKAFLALLVVFKAISTDSQTYYLLNMFSDAVFYFLPILLAFSEAQKLKCNPILAAAVAAIMMHPSWGALIAAGDPVHFFEIIPFTLASYTGSVIPILLVIFVQSYVEKFLNRIIPKAVELVFVPMLTFLIMGTLAFSVLGPIGSILGGYLATFFTFLSVNASWVPALLVGAFLPIMVMFGIHNGVAPLGVMQMSELGYDSIFGPGCVCSNMAQASASLVVAFRTKNKKTRQLATSASITAFMGITEPALYGVNLPKKYPLIAAMIGGGLGGLYAGLTHTHRFATGSSGLPAILLYIGDDTMRFFWNIIIAIVISIVVSAILTYILSFKFEKVEQVGGIFEIPEIKEIVLEDTLISSPLKGEAISLTEVDDEAFASEALGKGFAMNPAEGKVVAPFDGKVVALFPSKHAIGLTSNTGVELLIHVGLDTVKLDGKYFEALVDAGDTVIKGQVLLTFDIEKINQAGYSTQVPVVITNTAQFASIENIHLGETDFNEDVLAAKV